MNLMDETVRLGKANKIIWQHDKSGIFLVKRLTELLESAYIEVPVFDFDKIWKIRVPPKVKSFLWMLKLNNIPTKGFLLERGIHLQSLKEECPWCDLSLETSDHLFVECRLDTTEDFMNFCFDTHGSSLVRTVWLITIAAAKWSLWLARNERVFMAKSFSIKDLIFYAKMRALIWIKAVNESVLLSEKNWWNSPKVYINNQVIQKWNPPTDDKIKFYIDGAYKDGKVRCREILRNVEGDVIVMFSSPVLDLGVGFAELMAIKTSLKVFVKTDLKVKFALIMESNS
ncbi:hypothetical protein GQ457_01G012280 [Hibiscus cannabinus]